MQLLRRGARRPPLSRCLVYRPSHLCAVCAVSTPTHPSGALIHTNNCPVEDETRAPLQKAIDGADYEHGYRKNELDFLRVAVSVLYLASVKSIYLSIYLSVGRTRERRRARGQPRQ